MIRFFVLAVVLLVASPCAQTSGTYGWPCEGVSILLRGEPKARTVPTVMVTSAGSARPSVVALGLGRRSIYRLPRTCMLWLDVWALEARAPIRLGSGYSGLFQMLLPPSLIGIKLHWQGFRLRSGQVSSSSGLWFIVQS